jgi:hypothetical protein
VKKRSALPPAVYGTIAILAVPCHAQSEASDLTIDIGECVELVSALERYDCYERLAQAALAADDGVGNGPGAAARPDPAAATLQARQAQSHGPAAQGSEATEVVSAITKLGERRPNEQVITLENGQIWRQTLTKRYPLRIGQEVRIYPTRWGDSYRLSALDRSGFIQVERIE